ncbi:MAG: hypothetical protein EBS05_10785 [Proteobacteria bacterium]|nr:hypothetical protein [Pseudomonadota bacterium]
MKKPVKLGLWLRGFALLAVVGLWLENERAKARLAAYKAQLITKGEKLAIADHVPKLPPALSNAAPDFIAAANRLTELKPEFQPQWMRIVAPGRARVTWQQSELPTDKDPDLWPIVTAHVEENRDRLAEMATALERPEMVFDLEYSKGTQLMLPHLSKARKAAVSLANAASVDLHAGQVNSGLMNLLTGVRLVRMQEEPIAISQLVRNACGYIASKATWEFLQRPDWTDRQLEQLQHAWQDWDLTRGWFGSANMERAVGSYEFARCREEPGKLAEFEPYGPRSHMLGGGTSKFLDTIWHDPEQAVRRAKLALIVPAWPGWFSYADERWSVQQHQVWVDGARQAPVMGNFSEVWARMTIASKPLESPPLSMLLSRMTLPFTRNVPLKFATFETVRRLTFTAITLHRHRLKHGKFPESLGALVPEFLAEVPRDFMDGQPLRYKLQPDGQFLLWSVGEDFKDAGGDPTSATSLGAEEEGNWLKGRDWVWPQAATAEEVEKYHQSLRTKK